MKLARPVPVIWVYMTGWASADGTVHFADDVYGVDTVGGSAEATQRAVDPVPTGTIAPRPARALVPRPVEALTRASR